MVEKTVKLLNFKLKNMSKSNEHLYHCLDIMKADNNLSEETKIIMFVEYARLVLEEAKKCIKEKKPLK